MSDFYFNPFAFPSLISGTLILCLGIFVLARKPKATVAFGWFLTCLNMCIWLVSDFFLFSTSNQKEGYIFSKLVYFGITGIPFANLIFTVKICQQKVKISTAVLLGILYLAMIYLSTNTDLAVKGFYKYFWGLYPKAGTCHELYLFIWCILFWSSPNLLLQHYKKLSVNDPNKYRLLYPFSALSVGGLVGSLDFIPKYGIELYPIGSFSVLIVVFIIAYSILKHNLMDITIAIKKSFAYSLLMFLLFMIFVLIIILVEQSFKTLIGYKSLLISIISAIVLTIAFSPLKGFIQRLIDRLFLGNPLEVIAEENTYLKQELERSEKLKIAGTLALGLCHEIKNPLTTIKTFAEFLPKKYSDVDFVRKFSTIIPSEVERINKIVSQLLQFSKPSLPTFKKVDICHLIHEILDLETNELFKRKIHAETHCYIQNPIVTADADQLKQAFFNIILNAMDSMPNGGKIEIRIMQTCNGYLKTEIQDQGKGISKEDLRRIFDPFFTTKDEGTGLGLGISHQIIKNHNGFIEVESQVDIGTIFRIKLPQKIG